MVALKKVLTLVVLLLVIVPAQAKYKNKRRAHGIASYYGSKFEGRKTASGEVFANRGFTGASNKFRLGAYVRVINKKNGSKVYVKINDRMGTDKRVIDLTVAAAEWLDFKRDGTTEVKIKVVGDGKGRKKIRRQARE